MNVCLSLITIFAIALALPYQTHAEDGKKPEPPACDPLATAKWLTSLYTLQEGTLVFSADNPNGLFGQVPLAARARVSPGDDGQIIIDQEGMLPVSYGNEAWGLVFWVTTPLTYVNLFLEGDDFVPYRKDVALHEDPTIFRTLGEALHSHFTGLAGEKPEHHRVEDIFGFPTDYYIWDVGGAMVFLQAYKGNDSHGLGLRMCYKSQKPGQKEIARLRSRISGAKPSTQKGIFRGWNEPMENKGE